MSVRAMALPEPVLSSVSLDPAGVWRRESPRPAALRNATYDARFDWLTLFYDVYRVDRHVVMQGPPLLNLFEPLRASTLLRGSFRPVFPRARHVSRNKRGEIWLRSNAEQLPIDGPLGTFTLTVQPNLSDAFAGRRVLLTLSRNNAPRWIEDWIRFYAAEHGADAVLLYDNASDVYSAQDLQAQLRAAFPAMPIIVVPWPFPYGPQGGAAGAVDGVEAPWDSDFCQTGTLQHARFRFLLKARSVLNVDVDELVLSDQGRSIFAATETSRAGFIKFPGRWISAATTAPRDAATCRHADFVLSDRTVSAACPPKWCIVPSLRHARRHSWSVHNVFNAPHNRTVSSEFTFRHMKPISDSWKEDRAPHPVQEAARFVRDEALAAAFARTGLARSGGD
ncbi:glycosyltransferase family 92 protein [Novosphingobium sp. FKTRR1]|uniref:glycosyltransferase family 92 protein n=1 Tax=Novosphingobium sp. FKTRR1 TaxID=2879118 RepID=UPI001CF0B28B|nr:glycosyltransferase family 92 protein [Novosphingobium sp. FKTRR1]